jgi:hypothetical protein
VFWKKEENVAGRTLTITDGERKVFTDDEHGESAVDLLIKSLKNKQSENQIPRATIHLLAQGEITEASEDEETLLPILALVLNTLAEHEHQNQTEEVIRKLPAAELHFGNDLLDPMITYWRVILEEGQEHIVRVLQDKSLGKVTGEQVERLLLETNHK